MPVRRCLSRATVLQYDGPDAFIDLNPDWSVATTYFNGPGIDNHLRQTSTTTGISYFLTDHLGTTSALADSSGNSLEQLSYDSFGNSGGSLRTRYTYTGRERDPDTGMLYYRARFYDPQAGRFISEDPIGLDADVNLYAYVNNEPVHYADPLGLFPPSHPYCRALQRKIENLEREIRRRQGERHEDKLRLPWRAPGDNQKPSLSRWGHEMLINKLKAQAAGLKGHYAARCNDPDTKQPLPVPCRAPARIPIGQSQGELDSKAEAARRRYEFWKTVTIGGYLVGSVLTGGALFGGGAAAPALVPARVP